MADASLVTVGLPAAPLVEDGDSGGTMEEDRGDGRLIGVIAGRTFRSNTSRAARIWNPSTVNWLWDEVIGPRGACQLGGSGCTLPGAAAPLSDRDRDGLPDMRDLCPDLDGRGLDASRMPGGQHLDSDGDFVGDDCGDVCPGTCDADLDGDGVPVCVDTCPRQTNPGPGQTADANGNGTPDACDPCPALAPAGSVAVACRDGVGSGAPTPCDADGDGLGNACDLCPVDRDPSNANCNGEAERAEGVPERGDACDPAPCPVPALSRRVVVTQPGFTLEATASFDRVRVEPRTGADAAWTGVRFCPCSAATGDDEPTRVRCRDAQLDGTGGCVQAGGRALFSRPDDAWRGVTLTWERPAPRGTATRTEVLLDYGQRAEAATALWARDADYARWVQLGLPQAPSAGVFWAHAIETSAGAAPGETASAYSSGPTPGPFVIRGELRPALPPFAPAFWPPAECVACAGWPRAWLRVEPCVRDGACAPSALVHIGRGVTAAPEPLVRTLLAPEVAAFRFIAPAEPARFRPPSAPLLVGVDTGGVPREALVLRDGTAALVPVGKFTPPVDPRLGRLARASDSDDAAVIVYAASRGEVFTFRALDASQGELEVTSLSQGALGPLTPTRLLDLGPVLAATYSPADGALYVLDTVKWSRGREEVRLVEIRLAAGDSRVLASWPRTRLGARYHLAPRAEGGLWLAASLDRVGLYAVAALEVAERVVGAGLVLGFGSIEGGQIVSDDEGLTVLVSRGGRLETVGIRRSDLRPDRTPWRTCF